MRYEVKMTLNLALVSWSSFGSNPSCWRWLRFSVGQLMGIRAPLQRPIALYTGATAASGRFLLFSSVCFASWFPLLWFLPYIAMYTKSHERQARQHAPMPTWTANQAKRRSDSINSQTTIITTTRSLPQRLSPERVFGGGKASYHLGRHCGPVSYLLLPYFSFHLHMSITTPLQSPGDIEEAVTWLAYSSFAVNSLLLLGLLKPTDPRGTDKTQKCCASRPVELRASSHERFHPGENFLQFLQRTRQHGLRTPGPVVVNSSRGITRGSGVPGYMARSLRKWLEKHVSSPTAKQALWSFVFNKKSINSMLNPCKIRSKCSLDQCNLCIINLLLCSHRSVANS